MVPLVVVVPASASPSRSSASCGRTPSAATAPMSAFTPNIIPSTSSMRGRSGIARSPHGRAVQTRAALPTLTLVSGLVGLAALVGRVGRQDEDGRFARFFLIHAGVAIGTVAFSPVPKYGGVKLFLPFFPLFAVAAGIGFVQLRQALAQVVHQRFGSTAWGAALAALMLSTGLIDTIRFSGHELSSYVYVGGLPGADRGFERQYTTCSTLASRAGSTSSPRPLEFISSQTTRSTSAQRPT